MLPATCRCSSRPVHDVVGGDGFDRLMPDRLILLQLPRHQRRDLAEGRNELRFLPRFLQPAFEPVTEQRAERLPLSYAVQQPRRQTHTLRRQIDRQQIVRHVIAGMGQVAAAQHRHRGSLRQRRRVNEAGIVCRLKDRALFAGWRWRLAFERPPASGSSPSRTRRTTRPSDSLYASRPAAWLRTR